MLKLLILYSILVTCSSAETQAQCIKYLTTGNSGSKGDIGYFKSPKQEIKGTITIFSKLKSCREVNNIFRLEAASACNKNCQLANRPK
jgi:hypothetical protein